ncbi:MAG: hypothetical protein KZQ86_14765 [Candidatus Thiodiazotropha sp. (ex Lucinoma kastoroae)]|nr:hypothetical protein [Candidatus Thiodiazotropha sp. (ex Lucinoma kastoroae)]
MKDANGDGALMVRNNFPLYYHYWGKTAEDDRYHLLPYHCLDVAAVGWVFLRRNIQIRQRLANLLGLDEIEFNILSRFFLGLHDIGKYARHFQALQPDLYRKLQGACKGVIYGLSRDARKRFICDKKNIASNYPAFE